METCEYDLMDRAEEELWWYRALHARLLEALSSTRGRVLDAGCGTGGLLRKLARERPDLHLYGCEMSGRAATRARVKSAAAVAVGSVDALSFSDFVFDAVVSADVLCHRNVRPRVALKEMLRVLRPGGILIINMPAFVWLYSMHDRRVHNALRVTSTELNRLLTEAGFSTPTVRYWNGFLLPIMAVHRRIIARRKESVSDVAPINRLLNSSLTKVLSWERHVYMPAGGSVMATAVRP
jgi:SAM-dependent methyltransferase